MTADEVRLRLADILRHEWGAHVNVQGKRLVVEDEDEDVTIILVTTAKPRLASRPQELTG